MKLHEYLAAEGALTVSQLRDRIGVKSDAQIRQWQHGYGDRQPSPEYAMAIHEATDGKVPVWDTRPDDWHLIWPMLVATPGAPATPSAPAPKWDGTERRQAGG